MTDHPLVSVCIGAYNRENYLRETLDSVFAQTYRNLEVIVVDDASTDRTVDVVRNYGDRIRLIQRTENSGICPVTRNQAARAATGQYLAFLDSDDGWYPTKIEKQVEFLEAHADIPLCHTYCHVIDEHSNVIGVRHEGNLPPTGNCFSKLLRHCWVTNSAVMVRADIFPRVGGYFIEDRRYGIWGEDLEFYLRVARRFPLGLVDEVLTRYRRSVFNISAGNWRYWPESVPLHRMILARRDIWEGAVPRSEPLEAYVGACIENCVFWRDRRFPGRALFFAGSALRADPVHGRAWSEAVKSLLNAVGSSGRR
ncbi:MAG: glycosyltransferase [bacterium]